MSRRRKPRPASGPTAVTVVVMRLYIAGNAPNSVRAVANLQAICQEHLKGVHTLEIIDILEHPLRAMAEGVLVTPSLTKVSPLPAASVIGNLSDKSKVLLALGINGKVASVPSSTRPQPPPRIATPSPDSIAPGPKGNFP